ncbi:chymotrypsin-1-like [Prorops nasuta]|uniref:chymotrypsin-1-like n=1 Tax=Prorops nasuta TaxID=863751 RepID=UPI0034CF4F27
MQVLTALFFARLALCAYGLPSSRIVGGQNVPDGKYLYVASLRLNGQPWCTGSILNKRYILTSAECIVSALPSNLTVHVGVRRMDEIGVEYNIESYVRHPEFDTNSYANDVAVLKVNKDIVFNDKVQPVELVSEKSANEVYNVILAGWGRSFDATHVYHMKLVNLVTSTEKDCKSVYSKVNNSHICTAKQKGKGPCYGDFGGPLVNEEGKQVGILANGLYLCYSNIPIVYSSVAYHYKFIVENSKV